MKREWCNAALAGGLLAAIVIAGAGCGTAGKQIGTDGLADNQIVLEVDGMV